MSATVVRRGGLPHDRAGMLCTPRLGPNLRGLEKQMATKKDAPLILDQPSSDEWTVPKLLGIVVVVLGGFLTFIYFVSP